MIQDERIKKLNDNNIQIGEYVLYWMQSSVRADYNHALEFSIRKANDLNKPLIAFFGITTDYPEANLRHYTFLLEGLRDAHEVLKDRGIPLIVENKSPVDGSIELSHEASIVITDRGYTKLLRKWRRTLADKINCPLFQVESDVIVPIETASDKEEYAARTLRPKIKRVLNRYFVPIKKNKLKNTFSGEKMRSLDLSDPRKLAETLEIDRSVKPIKKI